MLLCMCVHNRNRKPHASFRNLYSYICGASQAMDTPCRIQETCCSNDVFTKRPQRLARCSVCARAQRWLVPIVNYGLHTSPLPRGLKNLTLTDTIVTSNGNKLVPMIHQASAKHSIMRLSITASGHIVACCKTHAQCSRAQFGEGTSSPIHASDLH